MQYEWWDEEVEAASSGKPKLEWLSGRKKSPDEMLAENEHALKKAMRLVVVGMA